MKTESTLSVNETALEKIRDVLRRSNCDDPVVELYEWADPGPIPEGLKTAIQQGSKEEDLRVMAKQHFEDVKGKLIYSLAVRVSERSSHRSDDLINVNGVTFAMPTALVEALRDYCLTFENNQFMLRSADNVISNLRSLK